jgi:phosphoribosylanthranilate isomerase
VDVKVKICGITSIEDAEEAVEAGADALGFMFYPGSPRHVTLEAAQVIERRLPPFIIRTGVFVDAAAEEVFEAMHLCGLNLLQFHGHETPEYCRQFGMMTMKAFRVRGPESLLEIPKYTTDAYLLDSFVPGRQGGTGEMFNWNLAVEAKEFGKPIFLAGGLTPEIVGDAVKLVQPFGVDVSSGVESSPGKKDAAKMRAFVAAVRSA